VALLVAGTVITAVTTAGEEKPAEGEATGAGACSVDEHRAGGMQGTLTVK
jgi:hypothetical protein